MMKVNCPGGWAPGNESSNYVSLASDNDGKRKFTDITRRHSPDLVNATLRQGQKMLNDGRPKNEILEEL